VRPAGTDPARLAGWPDAGGTLDEHRSKQLVAAYGLRITAEQLVATVEEALVAAARIAAPVALKLVSADIPHKTEAGVLRLGLDTPEAIRTAWDAILESARRHRPDARISGMLVQEMVAGGEELLLGVSRDPVFGPVITVGLGGIFVEVLRDVAIALPPLSHERALELLQGLRCYPLLAGARGRPMLDVDAAADAIVRLSWLAVDAGERLTELDLNPIRVLPKGQGIRVVDALVITASAPGAA
jgi:acetyltransferase